MDKADFRTLWELLQWFPRDYFDYRPAHEPWEDGAAIKGVGRVLHCGQRGTAAMVDIAVDVGLPAPPDDGGYFDEPDDEQKSDGACIFPRPCVPSQLRHLSQEASLS